MAQETIDAALVGRDPDDGFLMPAEADPSILPADLREILDGLTAGVSVQDEAGRVLYVNDDAAALSGFDSPAAALAASPDELAARFELLDEGGQRLDVSALPGRRALAGETPDPLVVGFRHRDGGERWSIVRARARELASGRRVAINTFVDITPRIALEQRLRASEERTHELAEDRRRASELARLMADAALRLDDAEGTESVVQAAAEVAVPVLADWCVVDLLDEGGELRRLGVAARDPELSALIAPLRDDRGAPSPGRASRRAVEEGRPVVILDPAAWWAGDPALEGELQRILTSAGLRNAIAQPLTARGSVIGAIVFATRGDRTFDEPAIAATAELASRLGISVANSQSRAAEQRARKAAEELASRMERLQAVAGTLADAPTVEAVVEIVADEARRALGAEAVTVGLIDESGSRLDVVLDVHLEPGTGVSSVAASPAVIELASASPLASAARDGRAVRSDVHDRADPAPGCAVPLVAGQAPIGALWLGFASRHTLDATDARLIRAYADLAAGAISRVRLAGVRELLLAANDAERARLDSVLRQMPIGVILVSVPDGRYVYANEAAQRLSPMPLDLGETPEFDEAAGFRPDGTPVGPDDWPLRRAMVGETVENELIEIAYREGERLTFSLSAAPILGTGGRIESALVTYTDVTDRIRAEERERFLARATEVLASSLDYERTVQAVADLVVPEFADWCVVHVPGDSGVPRRIAVAHRDPAKVELAIRLQETYPADPDTSTGTAAILRTGRTEFMANIPPELIDAAARDDDHRAMLRELALRSYISVPLVASGAVTGVLTLVDSGTHHFEPEDVAFAEALAARAAAAIEKARLFREGVRFKRLLDATGDAILLIDPAERRIEEANRGAAEQLLLPVDEIIGSTITDHLDDAGAAVFGGAVAGLRAGAAARTIEVELRRRDGGGVPVEVRLEMVTLDGSPTMILAIARDIGDRIEVRERLRRLAESEHARAAELNAVIQAMGEGVVVCDPDGRILLANPAAEDTFPEVDETSYADILAQLDDPDGMAPRLGRREGPVELRVRGADDRWIEVSSWPVSGRRDRAAREADETIVLLRDVTAQRQRQVVRDTFIGVLSHELRTPVTTIYAGAKVLGRAELDEATRQEIFSDIVVEAERLHRLVEDVVAMTRFQDGGGDVGAEPVLLQRLLPAVVTSEEARWPGVTFTSDIGPGLPTVIADPTYVEQVVRNLLSNAAKYGGRTTNVGLHVEAVGAEVQVRIVDDGPGFPSDEVDRLFELFFRSAGTARAAAGAGIGLFVCSRLIRAMGGRIWAVNRSPRGAEFGFALRVMQEE